MLLLQTLRSTKPCSNKCSLAQPGTGAEPQAAWYQHWLASREDPRTVVFGHWARQGLVVKERLRGLDSGCVWGRALSAWIAEEDRIVQVEAARAYADWGAS